MIIGVSEWQDNTNEKQVSTLPSFCESETERITRGPLAEKRLQQASVVFTEIFDNFMLEHMEYVYLCANKRLNDARDSANLIGQLLVDGQRYCLSLGDRNRRDIRQPGSESTKRRDSEGIARDLDLQTMNDNVKGQQYWSYRLGLDGVIRRYDIFKDKNYPGHIDLEYEKKFLIATAKVSTEDLLYIEMECKSNPHLAVIKARVMDQIINIDTPNKRLEEDMGLNNQPVSPEELHGLAEFLNRGVFTASSNWNRTTLY